jgi:hypothetical protein
MVHRRFSTLWRPHIAQGAPGAITTSCTTSRLGLSCLVALALLLLPRVLQAQTATVIGTITYQNGEPAVNVFVSIDGQYRYTDVGGRYTLQGVPQGRQHMTIKSGQKVLLQADVNITGPTTTVNQVLP